MNVVDMLKNGEKTFKENYSKYFEYSFVNPKLQLRISLKNNSHEIGDSIDYVNVEFYSRAINKMKHLKVYKSSKGLYFNAYGQRVYINDFKRL